MILDGSIGNNKESALTQKQRDSISKFNANVELSKLADEIDILLSKVYQLENIELHNVGGILCPIKNEKEEYSEKSTYYFNMFQGIHEAGIPIEKKNELMSQKINEINNLLLTDPNLFYTIIEKKESEKIEEKVNKVPLVDTVTEKYQQIKRITNINKNNSTLSLTETNIYLKIEGIPNFKMTQSLKDIKFRYNRKNKIWYIKNTKENYSKIIKLRNEDISK